MVHRTYRESDENLGKWNGIGGKVERGENIIEGMKREIFEETGLVAESLELRGTILWNDFGPNKDDWLGFVFTIDKYSGTPRKDNEEGTLSWVKISDIPALPMWKGDAFFLPMVFDKNPRQFHGYMRYEGEEPVEWRCER